MSCSARHNLENIAGFVDRMQFVSQLRKTKPLYVGTWEEIDGQIFDWGQGLKPARKKELVTRLLYEPLSLAEVIAAFGPKLIDSARPEQSIDEY
jgi:hypothetical protein